MVSPQEARAIVTAYFEGVTFDQFVADARNWSPELLLLFGIHVPENAAGSRPLPIAEWLESRLAEEAKAEALPALT